MLYLVIAQTSIQKQCQVVTELVFSTVTELTAGAIFTPTGLSSRVF